MATPLLTSLFPILVSCIIWVVYVVRVSRLPARRVERRLRIYSYHMQTFLLLAYLVLPGVTFVQVSGVVEQESVRLREWGLLYE